MNKFMEELCANKAIKQGVRLNPELPSMVAKICEVGGELWLGPVPTQQRMHIITSRPLHIQISCMR